MLLVIVLMFFEVAKPQEVTTLSSLLEQRKQHAFEVNEYLKKLLSPVPTRKGPVLFPNDAPPPPPTPLIVTSRPLKESIAKSELNTNLTGNTITDQSQLNTVSLKPNYFARITNYKPIPLRLPAGQSSSLRSGVGFTLSPTIGSNVVDHDYSYDPAQYTDIVKKSITGDFGFKERYPEYDDKVTLPPIYNAISQHAEQNALKTQQSHPVYDYQDKGYAFSYIVKDQKTGDDFSHSQRSSGSATNGEYRVRLPDGRLQIVSYTADENGYKADVKYEVDSTGNSADYNFDKQNQKEPNTRKGYNDNSNQFTNNAAKYNGENNKFYSEYNSPTKVELYQDLSKEYYNDYSSEYGTKNYDPHHSKFADLLQGEKTDKLSNLNFKTTFDQNYLTSTLKPNYQELKDVLTKALPNVQPTFNYNYPKLETTTENLVLIGDRNRFTSPNTPSFSSDFNSFVASTPRSYLVSTIDSLRGRVGSKPLLSDSFINRINKYLSFK
ncbi:unnamed protein product [Parnassius apollo]|uniref:(apollo) hypothetical protein n=1 Tax=Parnassius apollo TaxID=110799 RepID=A0A8S3XLX4_PARAO|nr:unnamed protein product [Parnassius apollo]